MKLAKGKLLATAAATLLGVVALLAARTASADNDFIVYSPYVYQGQTEIETYGYLAQDKRASLNNAAGYNFSVAHAFTRRWKTELYYGELNRNPGGKLYLSGYEFENTFQLTDVGEYWADMGFVASYVHVKQPDQPSVLEFGPLFEKHLGHFYQRLNLIWEKQIGAGADNRYLFRTAYSLSYGFNYGRSTLAPGMEVYLRPGDNAYQVGPVFYGEVYPEGSSELEFSLGAVFGVNAAAPSRTLLLRAEYEFF